MRIKLLMVDSIRRGGYFNLRNFDLKVLHSLAKTSGEDETMCTNSIKLQLCIPISLDNDDIKSSKRRSIFVSLIFVLKCFTKYFVIRN